MKLSLEQYLAAEGFVCPYCGSGEIAAERNIENSGTGAVQEIECLHCNHRWRDRYQLVAIEEIQPKGTHEDR